MIKLTFEAAENRAEACSRGLPLGRMAKCAQKKQEDIGLRLTHRPRQNLQSNSRCHTQHHGCEKHKTGRHINVERLQSLVQASPASFLAYGRLTVQLCEVLENTRFWFVGMLGLLRRTKRAPEP